MPWLTPDAPDNNVGRVLVIPNSYLASVNGALWELCEGWRWEEFGDETVEVATDRMKAMFMAYLDSSQTEFIGMASPINLPIWNYQQASIAPDWNSLPSFKGAGYYTSGNNAINGYIQWRVSLTEADWQIHMNVRKANNSGIAKLKIDGVEIGTMDLYNSSLQETVVNLMLPSQTTGNKILQLLFDTKHGSSSNYGWNIGAIAITRLP